MMFTVLPQNDGACIRQLLPNVGGKHMRWYGLQLKGHLPCSCMSGLQVLNA